MSATIEITSSGGLEKFIQKLKRKNTYLVAGFFEPEQATIATTLEYGTAFSAPSNKGATEVIIPPRPFMQRTIDEHQAEWVEKTAKLAKKFHFNMQKVFEAMGEVVTNDLRKVMQSGDFTPNAPATLKQKQGTIPLIDTGDLRDSIAYDTRTE